jgi:hypothetical protein
MRFLSGFRTTYWTTEWIISLQSIRRRDKKIDINKMLSKLSIQKLEEVERMIAQVA